MPQISFQQLAQHYGKIRWNYDPVQVPNPFSSEKPPQSMLDFLERVSRFESLDQLREQVSNSSLARNNLFLKKEKVRLVNLHVSEMALKLFFVGGMLTSSALVGGATFLKILQVDPRLPGYGGSLFLDMCAGAGVTLGLASLAGVCASEVLRHSGEIYVQYVTYKITQDVNEFLKFVDSKSLSSSDF